MADETKSDITALTVQLLSAFVTNNRVPSEGLAELIKSTRSALTEDFAPSAAPTEAPEVVPAVSVRKSLSSRDHILSLIDGKPYKTLKRHLAQHGLTPEQYRERYKLPKSYPLVAPSYSDARRAVAERLGLGRKSAAEVARTGSSVKTTSVAPAKEEAPTSDAVTTTKPKPAAKVKAAAKERSAPKAKAAKASTKPAPTTPEASATEPATSAN